MIITPLDYYFDSVIFDLDGTLVDSMSMWTDIDIEFLSRYGHAFDPQLQRDIEGMSIEETAVYFKQRYNIPLTLEEMQAEWIRMSIDKYRYEVPLKPHAGEFLDFIKSRGIRTAIASSNSMAMIDAVLDSLKIRDRFDIIVNASQVDRGKPFPDVYLYAAELLKAEPSKTVVFEDIPAGIEAGKAAGMKVIAVDDEYSRHLNDHKISRSSMFIRNFGELLKPGVLRTV